MKTLLLLLCMLVSSITFCQTTFTGKTKARIKLRSSPSPYAEWITSMPKGAQVVWNKEDEIEGYCKVIFIGTDFEGWILSRNIINRQRVEKQKGNPFSEGELDDRQSQPELRIFNNTNVYMNLKLDSKMYTLSPHERFKLTYADGDCSYMAAAKNILPSVGKHTFTNGHYYDWEFYIKSVRVR